MPRTFRRGLRTTRGPRRGVEWIGAVTDAVVEVAPGSFLAGYIVLPSQAREYTDPTVVRTRGVITVAVEAVAAAANHTFGIGIIPWSDRDDTNPGVGDIPRPVEDNSLDWMYITWVHGRLNSGAVDSIGVIYHASDLSLGGTPIDTRAMRKLGADQGVLLVFQNFGNVSMWVGWGMRCLVKE